MIPAHERRILEAFVRGVRLSQLALQNNPLNEYEEQQLKDLIKQRLKGMPLQYLVGTQGFYGREFYVNSCVLIPRPETEGLVERILKLLPEKQMGVRLNGLELGAGSGCISITLACERHDVWMLASEASKDALGVAEENAAKFRVGNVDYMLVSPEALKWQYDDVGQVDFIVSNPPYLVESDPIDQDVREHEPREALFVPENDPLYFYKFLVELMDEKLKPTGFAAFEVANQRANDVAALIDKTKYDVEVSQDLTGLDRYVIARKRTG